jgi:oxalate decarboxylase
MHKASPSMAKAKEHLS